MLGPWKSIAGCSIMTSSQIPRWQTVANIKMVMSAYLSEKWSDYDEVWYSESDSDFDKNDLTKIHIFKFKMADGRKNRWQ